MSKPIRPIANIDMDDNIAEYSLQLEADVHELFGDELKKLSEDARREVGRLLRCQQGWYLKLQPIQLAMEVVDMMRSTGFLIYILTKGNVGIANAWNEKVIWCKRWIPDAKITITEDKGIVYGKVLMDDYPGYINQWLEHRPRGQVVMMDRHGVHGNQGFEHPQVFRVKSRDDFPKLKEILQAAYERKGDEE